MKGCQGEFLEGKRNQNLYALHSVSEVYVSPYRTPIVINLVTLSDNTEAATDQVHLF
jgi:hypothetical protein